MGQPERSEVIMVHRVRTEMSSPQGGPYVSTMFFDSAALTAQDAADAVGAFWQAVDNLMSTGVAWAVNPEVSLLNAANGALIGVNGVTALAGVGVDASPPLPQANQMLIRWLTGTVVGGRVLRGRTFIPGMTEAAVTGGNVDGAWLEAADTAAEALVAVADAQLVIWHRPTFTDADPPVNNNDGTTAVVTSTNTWAEFAILRSRRD
jgi:hypothetical protein